MRTISSFSRGVGAVALMVACGAASGCSTMAVAGRAFKEVRGAKSEVTEVPGSIRGDFSRFGAAEVRATQTDLGGLVSSALLSGMSDELRTQLTSGPDAPLSGQGATLTLEPEVLWYHRQGTLGELLGSDNYAVTLVRMHDETGAVGSVEIVTKSAAAHVDDRDMAESAARAMAEWLTARK